MDLQQLSTLAQGGVTIEYNQHRSLGMSVLRYLTHKNIQQVGNKGMSAARVQAMIAADCVVFVQVRYRNHFLLGAHAESLEVAVGELGRLVTGLAENAEITT